MNNGRLTLVGAGPGHPDLITLKGINAIAEADVILYDDLANKSLLKYAKPKTEKIYVGKRVGKHSHTQKSINELIVFFAQEKGHVVRLKGGDPFIFGRGYEEAEYVAEYGIPSTVVPGISSVHAVPALQNIPLTSRGVSRSYWVITATTKEGELPKDIYQAAQSDATVVILMGTKKLKEIAAVYSELGKEEQAIAIIQNGTLPNEKMIKGNMKNIDSLANKHGIQSPAIMIIGDVVKLSDQYLLQEVEQQKWLS